MYKEIKGAIFDMDGTLVDSMWVWGKIDIDFIRKRNSDVNPEDIMKDVAHFSFRQTAEYFRQKFNMKETVDEIAAEWNREALHEYTNNVKVKNGVLELLEILRRNKVKCAIATSNSRELMTACLKATGIYDYFDEMITTDESGAQSKLDPKVYLYAASKIGVEPKDCVVFEDVTSAMKGARKAGMKVIGVEDKYTLIEENDRCELCDHFIHDFYDIHHLFIKD